METNETKRSNLGSRSPSTLLFAASCIILATAGILLSSLSTVVVIPYTTKEDYSYVRLDDSFNQTSTIDPNSSLTYGPWRPAVYLNTSLVQISLTSSGKLNVSLYKDLYPSIDKHTELLLHAELGEGFRTAGEYGNYWSIYYWAPPGPQGYTVGSAGNSEIEVWSGRDLSFVFANPESFANTITFQVKVYFLKAIGEREVTNYRPTIDPQFFYVGISLVAMAVVFESALHVKHGISTRK